MTWFILALLAPLLYSIVNLIDDNLLRFIYKGAHLATVISGLLGATPLLLLFFVDLVDIPVRLVIMMIAVGFLTCLYYFFYFRSLQAESPSVVIAMLGLVPATVPVLAYFLLGERLVFYQLLGLIMVILATAWLAVGGIKKFKISKALVPILTVVLLMDTTFLMSKYVYDKVDFFPAYMWFCVGLGLGGVYFIFVMLFSRSVHDLSLFKRNIHHLLGLFILTEMFAVVAEFVSNKAISQGPVSLVVAIGGIQPVYLVLIALMLYPMSPKYFREAVEGSIYDKLIPMLVIIIGLFIISAPS